LFDTAFDGGASQAAFGIVTVTNAHQLSTILAQELLGPLLARCQGALALIGYAPEHKRV
jgi:hypothetical protein